MINLINSNNIIHVIKTYFRTASDRVQIKH